MRSWPGEESARAKARSQSAEADTKPAGGDSQTAREGKGDASPRQSPLAQGQRPKRTFPESVRISPRRPAASCNLGRDVFPSAVAPWPARRRVPGEGSLRQRGPRRLPGTAIGQTRPHWYCHRKAILKTMNNLCILMNR